MFASLLALIAPPAPSALVTFVIVAVLIGGGLLYLPRLVAIPAAVYKLILVVCVGFLILWALALFGIL